MNTFTALSTISLADRGKRKYGFMLMYPSRKTRFWSLRGILLIVITVIKTLFIFRDMIYQS